MRDTTWRAYAKPIISEMVKRVGLGDEKLLKRELRDAYPFGEREHYPYKVWLDEIKVQLGKKTKKVRVAPGQLSFFG